MTKRTLALLLGVVLLFVPFGLVLSFGPNRALPASLSWRGGCSMGVGRDAILHGSYADPQVTWATDNGTGARVELLWPLGYTARFDPDLEVADASGVVIGHEGDLIIGSCTMAPDVGTAFLVEASDVRPPTWRPGDG
jgi:hypothetical protein